MPQQQHKLDPLEIHPITQEPFLRLNPPHANIIITPPRASDVIPSTKILNDPRVYPWMGFGGPENLYTVEKAEKWIARVRKAAGKALDELRVGQIRSDDVDDEGDGPSPSGCDSKANGIRQGNLIHAGGCPVRHIREIKEDGTEVYIGDIGLERADWKHVADEDERRRLVSENAALHNGNPGIIWQIGFYIAPSHHRQGIMAAAVEVVIHKWAVPRMAARKIRSTAFVENEASVGVMKKNGFRVVKTVEDCVEVHGKKRSLHVLEWRAIADSWERWRRLSDVEVE